MNTFEHLGEAMLMAEQGKAELARAALVTVKRWFAGLQAWVRAMPTTLPPTESFRR